VKEIKSKIELPANISSQYISALLLIAPSLPNGLEIQLTGDIVSRPYVEMTLRIMQYFGVEYSWEGPNIKIAPQKYKAREFYVEADWSAASYYYIIVALAEEADLTLKGLSKDSLQGDSAIASIGNAFGINTEFMDKEIRLTKSGLRAAEYFEYNFIECPDIVQSVSTMAAGMGMSALFSGLQTLRIKETDRIAALENELAKVQVYLSKLPEKFSKKTGIEYYMQEGKADSHADESPSFLTYKDHRMAMAFGPLAILFPIEIEDHTVVTKSYPNYWIDLESLGFLIEKVD
jgi:3-phosphoshikimate 1-carboxyvinyltransferase